MRTQKGESLVSLMVGLLISMIVIIGLLMIFRSTVQVTVPATADAISDGERISVLLRSHMLLQGAGFGIGSPENNTHLVISPLVWTDGEDGEGGSLSSINSGSSAILWNTDIDEVPPLQCEGIVPTNEGRLKYISAACADASQWASIQDEDWIATDITGDATDTPSPIIFTATTNTVQCKPFGLATTGKLSVTLTLSIDERPPFTSTTCLANFIK